MADSDFPFNYILRLKQFQGISLLISNAIAAKIIYVIHSQIIEMMNPFGLFPIKSLSVGYVLAH